MSKTGAKVSTKATYDFTHEDTGTTLKLRTLTTVELMPIMLMTDDPEYRGNGLVKALRLGLVGWDEQDGLPPFIKGRSNVDKNINALSPAVAMAAAAEIVQNAALSMEERGNSDSP